MRYVVLLSLIILMSCSYKNSILFVSGRTVASVSSDKGFGPTLEKDDGFLEEMRYSILSKSDLKKHITQTGGW